MHELESGMSKIMNPEEVKKVMESIDTDKNGTVNYTGEYKYLKIYRISGCNTWRKYLFARREIKTCFQ